MTGRRRGAASAGAAVAAGEEWRRWGLRASTCCSVQARAILQSRRPHRWKSLENNSSMAGGPSVSQKSSSHSLHQHAAKHLLLQRACVQGATLQALLGS